MGHTLPPFSQQFKLERSLFAEMRRALILRDDKALFDEMWDKAEFHVPAAEKAKHPLPITSVLLCINLEQEKSIYRLEGKLVAQNQHIQQLEEKIQSGEAEIARLRGEIDNLRWELEQLTKNLRAELLELLYPSYTHAP
jgi:septal ring factor EnvC (AmiA/AmiB activator)